MADRPPQQLLRLFRSVATLAVFVSLNSSSSSSVPIALSAVAAGVAQATGGLELTAQDMAVFRGLLGAQTIDLFWSTRARIEQDADADTANKNNYANKNKNKRARPSYYLKETNRGDYNDGSVDERRNSDSDSDNECQLFFSLNVTSTSRADNRQGQGQGSGRRKRAAPKRQAAAAPNPVALIADMIDAFGAAVSREQSLDGWQQRLIQDNMPTNTPHAADHAAEHASRNDGPNNDSAPSIRDFLAELRVADFYQNQIVEEATVVTPAVDAQYQPLVLSPPTPSPLPQSFPPAVGSDSIWDTLRSVRNIDQLYSHQAQAIGAILQGRSVVVSTATASGKSLIYQLPILHILNHTPSATFLLVFPTKALAQDQLAALRDLVHCTPGLHNVNVSTLDGDTPTMAGARSDIRQFASVILTNPDTLHAAMLPNARGWQSFWNRLRLVIIDEMHTYEGLFGQHVAHILARLRRLCTVHVQFVACSATASSDPSDHMRRLTHTPAPTLIATNGSPHGPRHMVVWDMARGKHKRDFNDIAVICSRLLNAGLRSIVFCKYRQACELVYREIIDYLDASRGMHALKQQVLSYRAGYSARERRQIEQAMFAGHTRMVVATSALELGIDIGSLDAVLIVGLPTSASALWQQIGRAGRQPQRSALAMVIATTSIIDQAALKHPTHIFARNISAPIDLAMEPPVTWAHLQCAAFERPINPTAAADQLFLRNMGITPESLRNTAILAEPAGFALPWDHVAGRWICAMHFKPWPPLKVPIRSIQQQAEDIWQVILAASPSHGLHLLEEVDRERATYLLYEGGIFLHRGRTYSIDQVDVDSHVALVSESNVSWYTAQRDTRHVTPTMKLAATEIGRGGGVLPAISDPASSLPLALHYYPSSCFTTPYLFGKLQVVTKVFGYIRIDARTKQTIEVVDRPSTLPSITLDVTGVWIDVPLSVATALSAANHNVEASIHAAQHALMYAISKHVGCLVADLDTECKAPMMLRASSSSSSSSRQPRIMVFERQPATAGASYTLEGPVRKSLAHARDIVHCALDRISGCRCDNNSSDDDGDNDNGTGCFGCVYLRSGCTERNKCISKHGASLLLQKLLE
ncbi:ATP-dependent 3'-5' DNA helicase [Kickxella alabastrina]|uniref:ATP-dependent 3'-5' DNA helicase n=1 Tax=Kickxella alabastrina TaxID=61397 RepID=A0ACC1IN30_9FUNG|nr:ATP-dependent 3'-5' DNA helicase [Kickxella alabastrina]